MARPSVGTSSGSSGYYSGKARCGKDADEQELVPTDDLGDLCWGGRISPMCPMTTPGAH